MLDDRKTAILSAVVQEYIATALPVGSTHIADAPGVRVSSATVRNEMAVLEQEGYLVQPHTSAGRIPTDKGYRFFVDHLATPGRLDTATRMQVGEFFRSAHGRLEEMLHHTSDLLAQLTNYAAVVVGPRAEAVTVRTVHVVGLVVRRWPPSSSCSATAASRTRPSTCRRTSTTPTSPRRRRTSRRTCPGRCSGRRHRSRPTGDPTVDAVCESALGALHRQSGSEHVYLGGASSMASAFDAVEVVRDVLRTLEQQFVVVSLVGDLIQRGMSVAIGDRARRRAAVGVLGGGGAGRGRR